MVAYDVFDNRASASIDMPASKRTCRIVSPEIRTSSG